MIKPKSLISLFLCLCFIILHIYIPPMSYCSENNEEHVTYEDLPSICMGLVDYMLPTAKILTVANSSKNEIKNSEYMPDEFVFNQKSSDVSNMRFGFFKTKYNGCGWIAAYNAATLLGKKTSAQEVISECERRGGILGGVFGMFPFALKPMFEDWGYKVSTTLKVNEFDEFAKENTVSILAYIHSSGVHIITVVNTSEGFYGFNVFDNSKYADNIGYSLQDFVSTNRIPIVLIGIK